MFELVLVKQKLADPDARGLWEHRLPSVAATEAKLRDVEAHLGEALDPAYRAFLMGGERFRRAAEMLSHVEDAVLTAGKLQKGELLPIAASSVDLDLSLMTRQCAAQPGLVVWQAGSEIDRFSGFDEYFTAMIDYNRLEVQNLRSTSS